MHDNAPLIRLVYVSRAVRDMPLEKVLSLIAKSRTANKARDITGALLYDRGLFLQILEGPALEVERLLAAISRDQRHKDTRVLLREDITDRLFSDWSMGHSEATLEDLASLPGLNGFFTSGKTVYDMGHPQLQKVLAAFVTGLMRVEPV